MTELPNVDFRRDISELPADEAQDRVEETTNLGVEDLQRLTESERFRIYNNEGSGGQETDDPPIAGGPTKDLIHLLETPADEWGDDEMTEANEWENYLQRTIPQYGAEEGQPLRPDVDPDVHRGEMALMTWGVDPEPDDGFP